MKEYRIYTGAYTAEGDARGIRAFRLNGDAGRLEPLGAFGGSENPSYLALRGDRLYAVNELPDRGRITAYAINKADGALTLLGGRDVPGRGLCHLSIWPDGGHVTAAGYLSGGFVTCPLDGDGLVGEAAHLFESDGSGPNQKRQEGPHAHSVTPSPDGRFFFGADLGSDRLHVLRADPEAGSLTPNEGQPWVSTAPGDGPRHFAFHPGGVFAYLIAELTGRVFAYRYDAGAGTLAGIQEASAIPAGQPAFPANLAAAVRVSPDGRFLYVSNRGYDSLAVFRIGGDGLLEGRGFLPAEGRQPRDFAVSPDGSFAVSANQGSGELLLYRRNTETGVLEKIDGAALPEAACALWVTA